MTSLTLVPVTAGYLAIDRLNDAGSQKNKYSQLFYKYDEFIVA